MLTKKIFLLIFITLLKIINSAFRTVKQLPFTPNENFKGWFIRYFGDENTIYTGNIDEEFKYNLITEEKTDYNSRSICTKGSMCPLIMFSEGYNKGIPTKIISQSYGKPKIFDFITNTSSEFPIEFNDCRIAIQISNRNEVYICGAEKNKESNKKYCILYLNNNTSICGEDDTISAAVLFTEYNGQEHFWQLAHDKNLFSRYLFINNITIAKHSNYIINKKYILDRNQISY